MAIYQAIAPAPSLAPGLLSPSTYVVGAHEDWRRYGAAQAAEEESVESMDTEELVYDLMVSRTDLPRFLAAAQRTDLPYLVVAAEAVRAWERREPDLWARFSDWLSAQGKQIVEV